VIVESDVTVLNTTTALYRGTFSRQRSDGGEINRRAQSMTRVNSSVAAPRVH
jgi:hypothetical protein